RATSPAAAITYLLIAFVLSWQAAESGRGIQAKAVTFVCIDARESDSALPCVHPHSFAQTARSLTA
ncbi:MAG TPA: hypothetical protein VEQ85_03600, partial [Lacipirellulaceae bacterium]|nr:hypothetical protein [Lacipirellulaceae bacterium]